MAELTRGRDGQPTTGSVYQHPLFRPSDTLRKASWVPELDLTEDAGGYHVKVEVPGVKPEDIEVSFDSGTLVVRGEKRSEHETSGRSFRRIERTYGSFERALRITAPVDVEHIAADCRDGVLHVTLPKAEEARPRQIRIGSESSPAELTSGEATETK
jgi:HSP20 family protein